MFCFLHFQPRTLTLLCLCKKILSVFFCIFLRTVHTGSNHNLPSALKNTHGNPTLPVKSHSVEFASPVKEYYNPQGDKNDNFCFERASVPPTEIYGEVPKKLFNMGENVSEVTYVQNGTPTPNNKKISETFEDVCDGTYI